jgi:DNA-binding Lrp family transcriptional regulator
MFQKLDKTDKKILIALNNNASASVSQLANKLKISREVCNYRISRLIRNKILSGFITLINTRILGYEDSLVCMQVRGVGESEKNEILTKLKKHPLIKWVINSTGNWDIITSCGSKDKIELAQIIESVKSLLENNLISLEILPSISLYKDETFDFIIGQEEVGGLLKRYSSAPNPAFRISKNDLKILKSIALSARKPVTRIAQETGLAFDTINKRIKLMMKNNVIRKKQGIINVSNLGYWTYWLILRIQNFDAKLENTVKEFVKREPHIIFADRLLGPWDVRIEICARNPAHFNEVFNRVKEQFKENLADYRMSIILEELKRTSLPEGFC